MIRSRVGGVREDGGERHLFVEDLVVYFGVPRCTSVYFGVLQFIIGVYLDVL